MIKATPKQIATLNAALNRAKAAQAAGAGTVKLTAAEYDLAKRLFRKLLASGAPIPEKAMLTAVRMGFLNDD